MILYLDISKVSKIWLSKIKILNVRRLLQNKYFCSCTCVQWTRAFVFRIDNCIKIGRALTFLLRFNEKTTFAAQIVIYLLSHLGTCNSQVLRVLLKLPEKLSLIIQVYSTLKRTGQTSRF